MGGGDLYYVRNISRWDIAVVKREEKDLCYLKTNT